MSFVPREGPSRRREALCWGSGRRGCVPLASVVDGLQLVWGAASGGICCSSAKVLLFQNDLLFLKVTSQLHHLSIKCAIHVLHVNKFNPHCLHRRPADEVRRTRPVQAAPSQDTWKVRCGESRTTSSRSGRIADHGAVDSRLCRGFRGPSSPVVCALLSPSSR